MQRARISFPIEFQGCAFEFDVDIIWVDCQRAIQNRFLVGKTAQETITERKLLQRVDVAGVEITGALQATHRLFVFTFATLNETLQAENTVIIGQGLSGYFQFGQGAVIIEIASIKVFGACQMCLTRIWMEAKCRLNCRFSQCQPGRRMVVTKEIKKVVSRGEQAIRFEK